MWFYLVDFVSSYMFVLKIKLCMFKYIFLYSEIVNGLLN